MNVNYTSVKKNTNIKSCCTPVLHANCTTIKKEKNEKRVTEDRGRKKKEVLVLRLY